MTAPVDTRESVEHTARIIGVEIPTPDGDMLHPNKAELVAAAAMLRRLLERAEKAEQAALAAQRSAADWMAAEQAAQDAADTTRAEALAAGALAMREAAVEKCNTEAQEWRKCGGLDGAVGICAARNAINRIPLPTDAQAAIERVREEEREACAALADQHRQRALATPDWTDVAGEIECVADAIRARGGKP